MCGNGILARLGAPTAALLLSVAVGGFVVGGVAPGGLGAAFAAPAAAASAWAGIAEGQVRLIAGVSAAGDKSVGDKSAGETGAGDRVALPLGLQFRMAKGWKIYWRSPGDAGYPPHLDWQGSENLGAADLAWPAPMRFRVLGFDTFGYEDEVVLPIRITPATQGGPVALRLAVDYLVCQEICVPASAKLSLALGSGPAEPTEFAALIDLYTNAVPGDGAAAGLAVESAEADASAAALRLAVGSKTPLRSPDVFVEGPPELRFGAPAVRLSPDGLKARMTIPVSRAGPASGAGGAPPDIVGTRLTLTLVDGARATETEATVAAASRAVEDEAFAQAGPGQARGLSFILLVAVAGGLILNVMPCVLPVLSVKLLKVMGHGGRELAEVRRSFLASAAGILFSFLVLAGLAALLKAGGVAVGWGMQFQYPPFLVVMVAILTLFAANLWGLFEIPLPRLIADRLGGTAQGHGPWGSFLAGAFVTLLATPCTAPFVGSAVGFALSRGPSEIFAVFTALGLGLAIPYLLVAAVPRLAASLPRPGAWMIRLRQVLGFALAATALWLVSVLAAESGRAAALAVLGAMASIVAVLWIIRRRPSLKPLGGAVVAALVVAALAIPSQFEQPVARRATVAPGWQPFELAAIGPLVSQGRVVLVDVTADWCLTCKVNEALVLDTERVTDELARSRVVAMRADWTHRDDGVARYLAGFGRFGIPFNAVYGPAAPEGIVLPELLTQDAVLDALYRAGAHALASRGTDRSADAAAGDDPGAERPL
jgi:suppressor for copper-sensitivity B